jgi:uncharacterized protein involved in exopolysaccharide biosynthesis
MTNVEWRDGDDISLFAVATTLLRSRWRIARWAVAGAILGLLSALLQPPKFVATASFVPQSNEGSRSGLASLAGQLGVSIPLGNQSVSPEFYAMLLKSRALLEPLARDTFVVPELGGRRVPVVDLLEMEGDSPEKRRERALKHLRKIVSSSASRTTSVVELSVATKMRSVSLAMASALLRGVNDYNQRTRQGQAAAERRFVGERLAVVTAELRVAENRLSDFLRGNREVGAPQLSMQRERLQRDIDLRQQLFATLTQAYEEARIREVRDIPVVAAVEPPFAPLEPVRSGRVVRTILGLVAGTVLGVVVVLVSRFLQRRREEGDSDASEFFAALEEAKVRPRGRASDRTAGART